MGGQQPYKFQLGESVDHMNGWEKPLKKDGIVMNRRCRVVTEGCGYTYINEYQVKFDEDEFATVREEELASRGR